MNTTIKPATQSTSILLSKKGMKELDKTIDQLTADLAAISKSMREADKSTTHDNRYEHNEKILRFEALQAELVDKQQIRQSAKLLSTKRERFKVAIGSVVDLIDQTGRQVRYTLVDSIEANPSDGRISIVSPLGSSLVGKAVKDIVEWGQGAKRGTMQLVSIS